MEERDNFFNDVNIDETLRRNIAFQTTNAIREVVTLAEGKQQSITYEQALQYLHDLSPSVYEGVVDLLQQKNESGDVKYYKDLAEAKGRMPEELIQEAIDDLNIAIAAKSSRNLKIRLGQLIAAREYFRPRKIDEHKILNQDFYLAERPYFGKAIYPNDSYRDYTISKNQALRLRLLHPDKSEVILGADMVYEQFDLLRDRVRFVHLQYKAWDSKVLYLNDKRLRKQISKMQGHLCTAGYCNGKHGKNNSRKFRLPYCSGFIRPTSNKSTATSKMISTGYHLPICELLKLKEDKLTRENIKGKSLSDKIFEEQFLNNMLGSRWIPMSELDKFYANVGLPFLSDTIRIHAQEVIIPSEEELQNYRRR
jgi:hypothetical protein